MLEDTKGVIRSRKSKKEKKDKRTHNVLQNTVQKTIEIEQQNPTKSGGELRCSSLRHRWP